MRLRAVSGIILTLLLTNILTVAFNVPPIAADSSSMVKEAYGGNPLNLTDSQEGFNQNASAEENPRPCSIDEDKWNFNETNEWADFASVARARFGLRKRTETAEDYLQSIRDAISEKGAKWVAGETSVSGLTFEERMLLCGAKFGSIPEGPEKLNPPPGVIPFGTFDWRNVGGIDWMTSVKDQGGCGSCWAFGTLGSMEAVINIVENDSYIDMDLSEQFLVSCCDECGDCGGGYPSVTYDFIMNTGVPDESCFLYVASDVPCDPCSDWADRAWFITDWFWVSNDPDSIKWVLQTYGPLGVAMRAPDDFLLYKSGIYEPVWSSPEWDEAFPLGQANHWVTLVGYDDIGEYWIVKNSWGSGWGEGGYGKIAYGVLEQYDYILAIISVEAPIPREHDLRVSVQAPSILNLGSDSLLNATVYNNGLHNETDVELYLLIDDTVVNNEIIPELVNGTSYTIDYFWTPTVEATYNVTAYAPPVPNETVTQNNLITKIVTIVVPPPETGWALLATDPDEGIGTNLKAIYGQLYSDIIYFKAEHYLPWTTINDINTAIFIDADQDPSTGLPDGLYPSQNTGIGADYLIVVGFEATEMWKWDPIAEWWDLDNPISLAYLDASDGSNVFVVGVYLASVETAETLDCVVCDTMSDWDWMPDAGHFTWSLIRYEHELTVFLETPQLLQPSETSLLNATVYNIGLNNETNVELQLLINGTIVNNETIPELVNGTSYTIDYLWTPTTIAKYNITAYAPPVPDENVTTNNFVSKMVHVRYVTVALISDQSQLLAITPILDSMDIGYNIYNDNSIYLYTEDLDLLTRYQTVIFYTDYGHITSNEYTTLESYLSSSGSLLVTGFDSLISDDLLRDIIRSATMGDNMGEPDLYVVDETHPIMNGTYGSFPAGYHIFGLYSDCDAVEADIARNAVTVAELWDGYDKIIATDGLPGKVVYWNGRGDYDWTTNVDCEATFKNIVDWMTVKYEHELTVSLDAPAFIEPDDSSLLNTTVRNRGLSNETGVKLFLLINGTVVKDVTIPELVHGSSYMLSYLWAPVVEGIYNVTGYVVPVENETVTENNLAWIHVYVGLVVKAFILDSAGTYRSDIISTWRELNTNWYVYGSMMISIDYTTLDKDDITYDDIAATGADVLVISSASDPWMGWEFTDSEIEAIKLYVREGHGLIATAGTLYYQVPNNNKLAPLFGLNETITWYTAYTDLVHIQDPLHPLFVNVPNPYTFRQVLTASPSDGRWDSNELVGGTYVALGHFEESAIVVYRGLVYISPWLEIIPSYYHFHLQLLYNAITWSCYEKPEHELIVHLESPPALKPGNSTMLNATVSNMGLSNETDVELQLLINGTIVDSVVIPELLAGSSYTLNYLWTPTEEGTYNVTAYAPPLPDEEFIENNVESARIIVYYTLVALLKNVDPWDNPSNEEALSLHDVPYFVFDSNDFGSIDLSPFSKVVIASDQDQAFYNAMDAYRWWFEDYVSNGGLLEIHAADQGWHGGGWIGTLPGGLQWVRYYSDYVTIIDPVHPVVTIPNTITDAELDYWYYSVLGYFSTYPASSHIIMIEDYTSYPAYLECQYGAGFIVASSQTLEWAYSHQYSLILENSLLYVKYPHELAVFLEAPAFLQPSESSLLNATVYNLGLSNETSVELKLLIDGSMVNNATIPVLLTGSSYTLSYLWTPTTIAKYNITAYVVPVPGEDMTANNMRSAIVSVLVFPDIIIVADDDGGSWISGTSLPEFELALTAANYEYFVWNESSSGNPSLNFLNKFNLVIWTCGDYWSGAVDPTDATTLEAYLAQGGNIILEGEDIGYDHHDDRFMVNVAHAIFETDYTGAPGLTVTNPTHPVTRDLPTTITWVTYPPYDDGVSPTNGGFEVIRYTETEWTAVTVFEGTSLGYVVYYAFPLYCLEQSIRDMLVINSIERDVAIVDVTASPSVVTAGETVFIEVTVENQGTITETFDVAVYYDDALIETSTVINLAPYASSKVFFYWDTSGVAGIVYEIKAVASAVPHEIDVENNILVDGTVTVYPLVDVYTQRGGRGEGAWSDTYAPQEEVIIFASVTHKGDPVQNKPVAFEVCDPTGYVWLFRSNSTDENGIATVSFRIPSSPVFGTWNATATGDIAEQTFNDTVTFKVGWLVEIVKVDTAGNNGSLKTDFVKGEHTYFNVTVQNIAFTSKVATITIVVYDECGVPIGLVTLQDWVIGPGRTEIFIIDLQIPKWAYVGAGTVYANAYTSLPQEGGTPYCPETLITFLIKAS